MKACASNNLYEYEVERLAALQRRGRTGTRSSVAALNKRAGFFARS